LRYARAFDPITRPKPQLEGRSLAARRGAVSVQSAAAPRQTASRAVAFILVAMLCISVNDMLIKLLSGGYPLHQMVFVRSAIGICASR
jgi:hypothetical protein